MYTAIEDCGVYPAKIPHLEGKGTPLSLQLDKNYINEADIQEFIDSGKIKKYVREGGRVVDLESGPKVMLVSKGETGGYQQLEGPPPDADEEDELVLGPDPDDEEEVGAGSSDADAKAAALAEEEAAAGEENGLDAHGEGFIGGEEGGLGEDSGLGEGDPMSFGEDNGEESGLGENSGQGDEGGPKTDLGDDGGAKMGLGGMGNLGGLGNGLGNLGGLGGQGGGLGGLGGGLGSIGSDGGPSAADVEMARQLARAMGFGDGLGENASQTVGGDADNGNESAGGFNFQNLPDFFMPQEPKKKKNKGGGSCQWCRKGECWTHGDRPGKGMSKGKMQMPTMVAPGPIPDDPLEAALQTGANMGGSPICEWCLKGNCWSHSRETLTEMVKELLPQTGMSDMRYPRGDRGGGGGRGGPGGACFKCGQEGHIARDCPAMGQGEHQDRGDRFGGDRGGNRGSQENCRWCQQGECWTHGQTKRPPMPKEPPAFAPPVFAPAPMNGEVIPPPARRARSRTPPRRNEEAPKMEVNSAPQEAKRPAAAASDLPPGWEAQWSDEYNCNYYFNSATEESVWIKPTA